MSGLRVGMLSLEAWDEVWRRNQHLAARVVRSGSVSALQFVTPPAPGLSVRAASASPEPGVEVITPPLIVPRRFGGHRVIGAWARRRLGNIDVLWVNDPVAGIAVARAGVPLVYDITDDWRSMPQDATSRDRIVAAEDVLARRADATVVCSSVLADRWRDRYGIDARVIPNGVDVDAIRGAEPVSLDDERPNVVYVGTVHGNRVDLDLVSELATSGSVAFHLVGPDGLAESERDRLVARGVHLHGAVPSAQVPSWLLAADVLICPHLVNDFTLSLDAIKAHEYLATDRPVVATPSSGFQQLSADGLAVVEPGEFAAAVTAAVGTAPFSRPAPASWADRAEAFAEVLRTAAGR
ncbi:MAG: teichuronic acid biosynthesis glycosyltransferase TuaH [Pseudonocardiales bacterium]|nr:teichuronic acid biosynthesis glycosyltransferase TuaH [Pseudonocardiales bacterium]